MSKFVRLRWKHRRWQVRPEGTELFASAYTRWWDTTLTEKPVATHPRAHRVPPEVLGAIATDWPGYGARDEDTGESWAADEMCLFARQPRETCRECRGKGREECGLCCGSGTCPDCEGSGEWSCIECDGNGVVDVEGVEAA